MTARWLRLEPGHRFPRHAHHSWSFGLVGAGSVRLWRAGAWHRAGYPDATVLHPGETHEGVAHPESGLSYVAVTVPISLVAELAGDGRRPRFVDLRQPAEPVRLLVASAREAVPEERRERTVAALCWLFERSGGEAGTVLGSRPGRLLAEAVKQRLDACFTEPVRISDIARDMAVAPATVIREFRRRHALSPYAYVVSRRVDLARQLLDAGVAPAQAANRAGFCDQSHLNRHFIRLVGVTPGGYQRA